MARPSNLALVLSFAAASACSSYEKASQNAAASTATATAGTATTPVGGTGTSVATATPTPPPAVTAPTNLAACSGPATQLTADITSDQNLTGAVTVTKPITIAKGVKVTVDNCASFALAADAGFNVAGSLTVTGKPDGLVPFKAASGATSWAGIKVLSGGTMSLTNAYLTQGAIGIECQQGAAGCVVAGSTLSGNTLALHVASPATISGSIFAVMGDEGVRFEPGADATVTNSAMYTSTGDVVGVNGGRVVMTNVKVGGIGYQHCGIHINAADHFEVHASELASNFYAFMVGPTAQLIVTGNNIRQSSASHMLSIGSPIPSPDISGNYWDGAGMPQAFLTAAHIASPPSTLAQPLPNLGPTIKIPTSLALGLADEADLPFEAALIGRMCPR